MNRINNIKIFFFCCLLLSTSVLKAQFEQIGKPFIENFGSDVYQQESENFSIAQDTNGYMYFGNLDGVLQYDGQKWRHVELKGRPQIAAGSNGKIYAGASHSFGEIITNNNSQLEYNSLSKLIDAKEFKFTNVNQILSFGANTLVHAHPYLFSIDSLNQVHLLLSQKEPFKIFGEEKPLIVLKNGLFEIDLTKSDTNKILFKNSQSIQSIIPYGKWYLILTTGNVWKIYDDKFNELYLFRHQTEKIFENNHLIKGKYLSNKTFALATENCGLIILDEGGGLITQINQNNGLPSNHIYDFIEDKNHSLWVSTKEGVSLIDYPNRFSIYNKDYNIVGKVQDIEIYKEKLYVASSQGLYVAPNFRENINCQPPQFIPVENIFHSCSDLLVIEQKLYVCNSNGIYRINENEAIQVASTHSEKLIQLSEQPDIILSYSPKFLNVFNSKKQFHLISKINHFEGEINSITEDKNGKLWVGTNYQGVYKVKLDSLFWENSNFVNYFESNGLPKNHGKLKINCIDNKLFATCSKGTFLFNKQSQTFEQKFYLDSLKNRWYNMLAKDKEGKIWFTTGIGKDHLHQMGYLKFKSNHNPPEININSFKPLKNHSVSVIYPNLFNIWIGTKNGLVRYREEPIEDNEETPKVKIRELIFGKDSVIIPNRIKAKGDIVIPYQLNSVKIQLANPYYYTNDQVLFQYKLEGADKTWSDWQSSNEEYYSGLSEGKYTLKVRFKSNNIKLSKTETFRFIVAPPYYRTITAFILYSILIISFLITIYWYRIYLYAKEKYKLELVIRDKTEEIATQKERAEDLVKTITPDNTAHELEIKGRTGRKKFELVTVLFSDVQGFTEIAEGTNPEKLLDELDQYVLEFDRVVEKYEIEKIKTIGDAYMCAGGIPQKNKTNPIDMVLAGLQMLKYAEKIQETSDNNWGMRFGIHTGPVIAGMVGSKKVSYDIWGDTVNIASRMESYGKVGHLNISSLTHELVSDYFVCEYRGQIPVKYKGNMKMYFVKSLKPEYAADDSLIIPNNNFKLKLQKIRFDDLEDLILTKLEKGLDKRLYYHNVKHTIDVVNQVEIIGIGEKVSEEEMLLLKTAALFHDLGHTVSFIDHEEQGIIFAKDILPDYHYSKEQIDVISELIYATKFPPNPQNKLEEIICDSDLDYLGRPDFIPTSNNLYLEMFEHGRINNKKDWNELQVKFLKSHQYYTETARQAREVNKMDQLKKIERLIEKENN